MSGLNLSDEFVLEIECDEDFKRYNLKVISSCRMNGQMFLDVINDFLLDYYEDPDNLLQITKFRDAALH